jgi:AAA15 family ATPase/GTPase
MLVEFSVANFRSFKDMQTLSMVAAPVTSKKEYKSIDSENTIVVSDKLKLLRSKAIYGANASGKSNLVRAIFAMVMIVRRSVKDEKVIDNFIEPFALSTETEQVPTFFQLIFIHSDIQYRYGFEIQHNSIASEWLFGVPKRTEVPYFVREGMGVTVNERVFREAKKFENLSQKGDNEIFRLNSLFLTSVAALGGKFANIISKYIKEIGILSGLFAPEIKDLIKEIISDSQNETEKKRILDFLQDADIGIEDFGLLEKNEEELSRELPDELRDLFKAGKFAFPASFYSKRSKYNANHEKINDVKGDFDEWESEGTKKLFYLSPLLIDAFDKGEILFIDEFDARLHPRLTRKIVSLFNSSNINKNNAQLIFVTHDTGLLKAELFRRDQICFVEKDRFGASSLRTLIEFKGVRNDASFEKEYLEGKYGAVPFLGDFGTTFQN